MSAVIVQRERSSHAAESLNSCGDVKTIEVTDDCKIDRKLAKTMTTLTAALDGKKSLINNSS